MFKLKTFFLLFLLSCQIKTPLHKKGAGSPPYWPTEIWKQSTPEKQGVDSKKLIEMMEIIKDKDYDQNKDKEFDFLRNRKDQKKLINKGEKPEKLKLKVTNTEKKKDQITKKSDDGKIDIKSKDKTFSYKRKSTKIVHLCRKIDECDINLISKKIYDLGKEKSYPDITNSKQ